MSKKLTTLEWVGKAKIKHGDRYDYSESIYIDYNTKIKIVCKEHGEFLQFPGDHLKGCGCRICAGSLISSKKLKSFEEIKELCNKTHNNKYNYPEQIYLGAISKIKIICPIHGIFEQRAADHLKGRGCSKCQYDNISKNKLSNTKEFIEKAIKIHGNLYNYDQIKYSGVNDKVIIMCKIHGNFLQTPSDHLQGCGCPICSYSHGELLINNLLKEKHIKFKPQYEITTSKIARNSNLIRVDFYIEYENKKYVIEYNGEQHYKFIPYFHKGGMIDFEKQQRRDNVLKEYCELNNMNLIIFNNNQSEFDIINKINNIFK